MLHINKKHQNYRSKYDSDEFFNNQIWRVNDVADYLRCSVKHIYNLTYRREIPFVKKGKLLFFIPTEIHNWILEGDLNEKHYSA
ncbi:MAG: helix-turn-helix domain-containing protein [Oligoflexia bacterium]|nr:helix-turn-helix domain-containing protein [Oligoflexia bacterium]